MVLSMKDIGKIIWHMEKGNFSTLTVTFLKAIGKTTKSKVMACILIQTVPNTKAIGTTITNMGKVKKSGKMAQFTKVNIRMA